MSNAADGYLGDWVTHSPNCRCTDCRLERALAREKELVDALDSVLALIPHCEYGPNRCKICGWPFRADRTGCTEKVCSYVPKENSEEAHRLRKQRIIVKARAAPVTEGGPKVIDPKRLEEYASWQEYDNDLQRDAAEMARELLARQWVPFESAPKDGRSILVWRKDAGVFTVAWLPSAGDPGEYGPQYNGEECWFTEGGDDISDDLPAVWMPMPADYVPPAESEAK